MASDFNYKGECRSTLAVSKTDSIVTQYTYHFNLKAGFNFIEYKIKNLETYEMPTPYGENESEMIDKPIKIASTSSPTTLPNTKWIAKYF